MIPKVNGKMSDHRVNVTVLRDVGHINLRGDSQDDSFRKAAEAALGQPLPVVPNTVSAGEQRILWLGPDEWLVVPPLDKTPHLLNSLSDSLSSCHAAVNDISGGNVALPLAGASTRDLLAKGCTLDLHPTVFEVGSCAQSGLGKAAALFVMVDDAPTFDLIVRRSFSEYLIKWLRHSGREYGIEFD